VNKVANNRFPCAATEFRYHCSKTKRPGSKKFRFGSLIEFSDFRH
jgi:hypothetical protein